MLVKDSHPPRFRHQIGERSCKRPISTTGAKLASRLPSGLSRPRFGWGEPHRFPETASTRIFPSGWTAKDSTFQSAEALKLVSRLPSVLSRPMRVQGWPPSVEKAPPTITLPSVWTART